MKRPFSIDARRRAAFTLVELLVAMAVLGLLIALVAQMVGGATLAITGGHKGMDADAEARMIFDRMSQDFSKMVRRTDVDYVFKEGSASPQPGNDVIAFYAGASGYYDGAATAVPAADQRQDFSVVGYRVIDAQLHRLAKGLSWGTTAPGQSRKMVFLPQTFVRASSVTPPLTPKWPGIESTPPDGDYQVLGELTFRFEYWYQLTDGTFSDQPYLTGTSVNGFRDVQAIVVALALLDSKSRAMAGLDEASRTANPAAWSAQWQTLQAALPDFVPDSPPTARASLPGAWIDAVNTGELTGPGTLPPAAAAGVRLYSRAFPLHTSP